MYKNLFKTSDTDLNNQEVNDEIGREIMSHNETPFFRIWHIAAMLSGFIGIGCLD